MPALEPLVVASPGAAQSRADQAWLACLAAGLVLLVVCSLAAFRVALLMNLGGLVLTVINAPAPRLWAAVLMQRSIGSPGEWGVFGTLAVLGNVLATWLITEPRYSRIGGPDDVIRRLARWSCVIGTGALAGALWGGYEISYYWGWDGLEALVACVGFVELPVNGLLYWHLSRVAGRFHADGERSGAAKLLTLAAVLIPVACAAGVAMSIVRGAMQDQPVVTWRVAQSVYGAAALSCGVLATVGVLRLTAQVLAAASDRSVVSLAGKLARLRGSLGRFVDNVRADPTRWAAVAGLVWLLWNARPLLAFTALVGHRKGLGGDLPTFNFVGPKIWATALAGFWWDDYYRFARLGADVRVATVSTVLAVWLITTLRPPGVRRTTWALTRWAPTLLVGLSVGLGITIRQADYEVRGSYWAAAMALGVEAPSTFLIYVYLASLAAAAGSIAVARRLKWMALLAGVLILLPLGFYVVSASLTAYRQHPVTVVVCAAYGMAVFAASVAAWAMVVRLAWTLATWDRRPTADTILA